MLSHFIQTLTQPVLTPPEALVITLRMIDAKTNAPPLKSFIMNIQVIRITTSDLMSVGAHSTK